MERQLNEQAEQIVAAYMTRFRRDIAGILDRAGAHFRAGRFEMDALSKLYDLNIPVSEISIKPDAINVNIKFGLKEGWEKRVRSIAIKEFLENQNAAHEM